MGKPSLLTVYNIFGYPTETDVDRKEFWRMWFSMSRRKTRVSVEVRGFGFRAMPTTPMQWEGVEIRRDWNKEIGSRRFVDEPTYVVTGSHGTSSARLLLYDMIVLRALPTQDCDRLFHAIATNGKLRRMRGWEIVSLLDAEFDLSPYTRQYDLGEDVPTSWLTGIASTEALRRDAKKMRAIFNRDAYTFAEVERERVNGSRQPSCNRI